MALDGEDGLHDNPTGPIDLGAVGLAHVGQTHGAEQDGVGAAAGLAAAHAQGWWLYAALLGTMVFVFGAIPFTDATIVRFVDDSMRSRVAGLRLAISLGISSSAVWALGPAVKAAGFGALFAVMAGVALFTAALVLGIPGEGPRVADPRVPAV